MTIEKFEKAQLIKEQIRSIDEILSKMEENRYECDPPIRMSSWALVRQTNDIDRHAYINLNQGECVTIIEALKGMKKILELEFGKL